MSDRPDKPNVAMRNLTIFCLAVFFLSRPVVLLAQTNNSSGSFGNRTTGGANQGTSNSSHASGTRSGGTGSPAGGNLGSGTHGNSGGNLSSLGENGFGHTGSAAARRARMESSSAGGSKGQSQNGLAGDNLAPAGTYFVGAAQADGVKPASPLPGNFAGPVLAKSSTGGQSFGPYGVQGGLPGRYDLSARTTPRGADPDDSQSSQVSAEIARHLQGMPALHFLTPVQVKLDGGTAILRGTVATDHDRELAGRVVLLEATVDDVVNLLAVASPGGLKRP